MFPINIRNSTIYLTDIKHEHLPLVLGWYNKIDHFKYATGIDMPITLNDMAKRYAEIAVCPDAFFTGIYINNERMIGILKGKLQYQNRDAVWITSIVIDQNFQKKGYGKTAVELLLKHLKRCKQIRSAYLAVVEENAIGRIFWTKQKFQTLKRMEKHANSLNKQQSILIMYKRL